MPNLNELTDDEKQIFYRDARYTNTYDGVWQNVGKCVFCDLNESYVLLEENGIVLTVALYAYIDGHMMIIPRRHVRSVKELTPAEWETMRKFMYLAKKMIRKAHAIKGMQIVQKDGADAQSTVEHIHFHCIPFDAPDLNVWNYRKLTNTPKENATFYKALAKDVIKLSKRFDEKYTIVSPELTDKNNIYKNALAQTIANKKLSQAKKTAQVGASIIVGTTIISRCNANISGGVMEIEKEDGTWTSPPTVAHAEERCITTAAKAGIHLKNSIMIVTLSPCLLYTSEAETVCNTREEVSIRS